MKSFRTAVFAVLVALTWAPGALAGQSAFVRWQASQGHFSAWQRSGVGLAEDGALRLDPQTAVAGTDPYAPGTYNGGNFYNGGSFRVGEATSPVMTNGFAFREAVASWEAETPTGTWVETQIRAQISGVWTKWYNLGVWAADTSTVRRHSAGSQSDTQGYVGIDTLVVTNKKAAATAFQVKVRLFSADGIALPRVRASAVTLSTSPEKNPVLFPGNPAHWDQVLAVPECSQMVYPDGGQVWCSPTSTSMVLRYWAGDTGACEPHVRAAVSGVYDWIFRGHGNWPFNTAYAASKGLQAHVTRFTSLAQLEPWISAGVPAILSISWGSGELTGAPISASAGHLMVLVGFDASGNPVVNDPAASTDAAVQRTYLRSELESLWLQASAGTAYLIHPAGWPVPAR
ncbi:peptidase C39 family protein [Archangium minus]|uniref:Peptidase C39 family protein n=1 Tax=Archangium minus TaxID=83450 RepID=A0ABY9WWD6_9BACT|nr:peptidase C39 family protein [Archangium minus]